MLATRFYAMLKAGKEIAYRKDSRFLMEMCDVAAVSFGGAEYAEKLQKVYYYRSIGQENRLKNEGVMDPADPNTGQLIQSMFNSVSRAG
jgi:hypothetical protein